MVGLGPASAHNGAIAPLLDTLDWDDRFVSELPGDPRTEIRPRQVPGAAWSPVAPTPVADPVLLAWSPEVAAPLGLPEDPAEHERADLADVLAGNRVAAGSVPFAARYGGHQFGNWAGQLGDGRAIALGEIIDADGVHQTLQLKGAGPTPYSRNADGRAVLRSSVREFLCSEAMHFLGVPTTRALSLVATGDRVVRDMFYDGHPEPEPGAIVCRVAPSFTRFGTFELPAAMGETDVLRDLVDFTLRHDFPAIGGPDSDTDRRAKVVELFDEVVARTAHLMIEWMRVGFVHGVMNTDNLSILGLTIDYGPYGWLEDYDPDWTPNTTDRATRRYRYGQQPAVAQWNLSRLAGALNAIVEDPTPFQAALGRYGQIVQDEWGRMLAAKLGLGLGPDDLPDPDDRQLIEDALATLTVAETDMTEFFRTLPAVASLGRGASNGDLVDAVRSAYYQPDQLSGDVFDAVAAWLRRWRDRIGQDDPTAAMHAVNPRFVLRNYLAQLAIDAAEKGDTSVLHELHDTLRRPYDEQPGREHFAELRPEWARSRPGCSMLSCSS